MHNRQSNLCKTDVGSAQARKTRLFAPSFSNRKSFMCRFLNQLTEEIKKTIPFGPVAPMLLSSPFELVSVEFFILPAISGNHQQNGPGRLDTGRVWRPRNHSTGRFDRSGGRPGKACFLPFHLDLRGDLCYPKLVFLASRNGSLPLRADGIVKRWERRTRGKAKARPSIRSGGGLVTFATVPAHRVFVCAIPARAGARRKEKRRGNRNQDTAELSTLRRREEKGRFGHEEIRCTDGRILAGRFGVGRCADRRRA